MNFFQRVVQYSQDLEGGDLHHCVLGLNESSTEDDMKNPILNWLLNISPTKIITNSLLL